jgi:meso-butanediol dehydrogenase / (S,S)-butanediol dehydrogenase / diacetyl reductase
MNSETSHSVNSVGPSIDHLAGRFVNKVAVVTGGTSGIGQAAAERLVAEGASVVLAARNPDRGSSVVQAIDPSGERVMFVATDVSSRESLLALYEATAKRFGRLDVVVNAAGLLLLAPIETMSSSAWDRTIATNLTAVFDSCQLAIPYLRLTISSKLSESASIVNVTSVEAVASDRLMGAYSVAKAGVLNLTRTLALELAHEPIRVNAVAPGAVDTPMTKFKPDTEALTAFETAIPMGRVAQPKEIAAAIAFLAADEASFVTGINFAVDGGLSAATGHPDLTRLGRRV